MHLKSTKKLSFQAVKVAKNFTSENLTSFSGLAVINDYTNHYNMQIASSDKSFIKRLTEIRKMTAIL